MARPRLGLFDQKFAQQPGYRVVDELAAVVGMKAANHKRELSEHPFEQWNQPKLRDLRRGGDNLPLRHFVDRVDVINAFHAVAIALMDRVDAQISRRAVRLRLAPFANANHRRPRRLIRRVALAIGGRVAEPINLRHRNRRQPRVDGLAVVEVFALQNPLGRRATQIPVRLVDVGSCSNIPYEHYNLSVEFGSSPERVDELVAAVFKVFDEIKAGTVSDSNLTKIKEIELRGHETGLKQNASWLNAM